MTAGRLRRIGPDRWAIELDAPDRPKIGEVSQRSNGFVILMMADETGTAPLSRADIGPHSTMAGVTGAITDALRMSAKFGRR